MPTMNRKLRYSSSQKLLKDQLFKLNDLVENDKAQREVQDDQTKSKELKGLE